MKVRPPSSLQENPSHRTMCSCPREVDEHVLLELATPNVAPAVLRMTEPEAPPEEELQRCAEFQRYLPLHRELTGALLAVLHLDELEEPVNSGAFCYVGGCVREGWLIGSMRSSSAHVPLPPTRITSLGPLVAGPDPVVVYVEVERHLDENFWLSASPCPTAVHRRAVVGVPLLRGVAPSFLVAGNVPRGLGPERAIVRARKLQPTLQLLAESFVAHQELLRWTDVAAHLPEFEGVCAVIDEQLQRLIWVGSRNRERVLENQVACAEERLLQLVAQHARKQSAEPPPCPAFEFGKIVHVALDRSLRTFGDRQLTVVAIRSLCKEDPPELSQREQQVARLLAEGYTIVNAAAILDLSENTVRTYVRRLYAKLGVRTRADLVREVQAQSI